MERRNAKKTERMTMIWRGISLIGSNPEFPASGVVFLWTLDGGLWKR